MAVYVFSGPTERLCGGGGGPVYHPKIWMTVLLGLWAVTSMVQMKS